MTTQTHYSGFPTALASGGTFDLGDPVSQWWLSRLPANPYTTIANFRLIANVSSSAIDITTITRYTNGSAVVWQNRIEGSFQIDANNARASGTPTITYQAYTSWNSDGSRGAANYESTTPSSGPTQNNIPSDVWSRYFEQNSRYQSTQFAAAPNTSSGTFTSNGDGTGSWSLNGGESGTFQVTDYRINSDGSISYQQRFFRSNGSTYGDVRGTVQLGQVNNSGQYSGTWTLTENNGIYTFRNFTNNGILVSTGSFQPTSGAFPSYGALTLNHDYAVNEIVYKLIGAPNNLNEISEIDVTNKPLAVSASTWTRSIEINYAAKASDHGARIDAKQIIFGAASPAGSVLLGGSGNDTLWGKAGWDIIDGGAGNDLIHGGNGRDILAGGVGSDELWGDFGWNTYKSEKDGYADLIVIKSDEWLLNWLYGKAGNNTNGDKCDIIEGLDSIDRIRIVGCETKDLTFAKTTAKGLSGIGIYAKGALEALYTGGDLSVAQIQAMTTGDGSPTAMANQISSYDWSLNPNLTGFIQGGTDSVTGQLLIFSDLGTIESDKVYGKDGYRWIQPIVNNDGFTKEAMDRLTTFEIEFEFNNQYIVATARAKGETREGWLNTNGKDWTQRLVLKGSFSYANSKLAKATLDSYAWQLISQSPPRNQAKAEQGGIAIFASGSKLSPTGNAISTTGLPYPPSWTPIVNNTSSWSAIYNHSYVGYGLDADIPGNPFVYGEATTDPTIRQRITEFGGGQFFQEGWASNPFASSLI